MDKGHGPEQEKYSFLQENIKKERTNLSDLPGKCVRMAAMGLVLGFAMCIGFFSLKPWAEETFQKNPESVEISEEPEQEPVVEDKDETPVAEKHDMSDFRELQSQLSMLMKDSEKKVVTIYGIEQNENWTDAKGKEAETTGVIVGDNGREFLILASYSDMKKEQLFRVTFYDHATHEAVLKQKDVNNNLAVFSVSKGDMKAETKEKVVVASFSNTNAVKQGEMVFVVGNPFGYEKGIATGIVSSTQAVVQRAEYDAVVLVTDIVGSSKSSGVIFNSYGNVIGIVDKKLLSEVGSVTLATVGITQMKEEIELMSNGKNVPYIGVIGTIVSEDTSKAENIPQGLYVQAVEADSPAMAAGIRNGDIITSIGGVDITSMNEYHKAVMNQEAGQQVYLRAQRIGLENYVDMRFTVTVGVK